MDFEQKMEEFDALLANAKNDEERADALQKICMAFDEELKKKGVSTEQREDQLAEFMAAIMDMMEEAAVEEAEAGEDGAAAPETKGELDT